MTAKMLCLELVLRLPAAEPALLALPVCSWLGDWKAAEVGGGTAERAGTLEPSCAPPCWLWSRHLSAGEPPKRRAGEGPCSLPRAPWEPRQRAPGGAAPARTSRRQLRAPGPALPGGRSPPARRLVAGLASAAGSSPARQPTSRLSLREPARGVFNRRPRQHTGTPLAVTMGGCWAPNPPPGQLLPALDTRCSTAPRTR